jgi:SAM-dependent methyltransferase
MMKFFEPTAEFLDWLAKYAKGRFVFDVGCGAGHILLELHKLGTKALGIDPVYKYERAPISLCTCVMPCEAKECALLLTNENSLVLFCRPCHNGFVAETIKLLPVSSEILYISKPDNVKVDLPGMETILVETPPCPEELVYRVIKRGD